MYMLLSMTLLDHFFLENLGYLLTWIKNFERGKMFKSTHSQLLVFKEKLCFVIFCYCIYGDPGCHVNFSYGSRVPLYLILFLIQSFISCKETSCILWTNPACSTELGCPKLSQRSACSSSKSCPQDCISLLLGMYTSGCRTGIVLLKSSLRIYIHCHCN